MPAASEKQHKYLMAMAHAQKVTLEVTGLEAEAIRWMRNRPKTYKFEERRERLARIESLLNRILQQLEKGQQE